MSVYVIPTVTVPATAPQQQQGQTSPAPGPYDLVALADMKDELNIPAIDTSKDTWLARAITQASIQIANECNRVFAIEGLQDQIFVEHDRPDKLQLSRWPIVNLATPLTNADAAANASVLSFAAALPAFVQPNLAVSGLNIQAGATVQGVAGGSITLSLPILDVIPTGTMIAFGLALVQQIAVGQLEPRILGTDYQLDPGKGELLRLSAITGREIHWEGWPLTVNYSAGYVAIPADLQTACMRTVTERYWRRGVDPSLKETEDPRMGRRVYWVGGTPRSGDLPDEIMGTINRYRVPVAV